MKKLIITLLTLSSLSSYAITCKDKETGIVLQINDSNIVLTNNDEKLSKAIKDTTWDGHVAGMITGRGFSISYENHFGCIRRLQYTGPISESRRNIRSINFGTCAGGSTPDELCLRN